LLRRCSGFCPLFVCLLACSFSLFLTVFRFSRLVCMAATKNLVLNFRAFEPSGGGMWTHFTTSFGSICASRGSFPSFKRKTKEPPSSHAQVGFLGGELTAQTQRNGQVSPSSQAKQSQAKQSRAERVEFLSAGYVTLHRW